MCYAYLRCVSHEHRHERSLPAAFLARHILTSAVSLRAGKFYTLATGSNERRWNKMKPRLEQVVQSFEVTNRYDAAPIG